MNTLNKPTFFLWLPVVVWAATFTYGTCLLFYLLNTEWEYYESDYVAGTGAATVAINILTIFFALIMAAVYVRYAKEFLYRLLLLITNVPVAFAYLMLARAYAPFLN